MLGTWKEEGRCCLRIIHAEEQDLGPEAKGKGWGCRKDFPTEVTLALVSQGQCDRVLALLESGGSVAITEGAMG